MKKPPKIRINKQIQTIHYELDGNIEDAIEYLQFLKAKADEQGVKYSLDYNQEYEYGGTERYVIGLVESREETDEEYEVRIRTIEEHKKAALEQRRLQFEQLSKEFGEK